MDTINDQTQNTAKTVDPVESTMVENSQQDEIPAVTLSEASNVQDQEDDTSFNDTFADIDLSNLELSDDFLAEMDQSIKSKEAFESIMNACSSTAQALKQTISDVLKSRENIVIAAGDTTTEFETSLNKKIADFETVVSGCCVPDDIKTDLTNIKHPAFSNVIITEVNESDEVSSDCSSSTTQVQEEKKNCLDNDASNETDLKSVSEAEKITEVISEDSSENTNKEKVIKDKEVKTSKVPPARVDSVPVLNASEDDKIFKKQSKSSSNKKKGEKSVDQILKSLSNYSSVDDKLQTLCKRHAETLEELRLFEPRMKQLERQVQSQQREKEQLQAEHNRMILAKSRLESLCRELQRQNRAVKEESLLRIKEEEERRKEIANKFQLTLNDISSLMQDHSKKNIQLREENQELAKKLKALVDHYDMWEKHMEKVVQQNHLEAQLAKAKHAKINLLLKQETEKFLREKQSLLENMSELQKKCTQLTSNELKLRTELGDYTSKYEEFQTVLNKSSQVFSSFKNDMETTSKKIKKLEKETNVYKQKWESSNNALLGMINDKQKHDKELSNVQQRVQTLEKLCRALQAERNELQNQLNSVTGSAKSAEEDVPSVTTEAKA